MKERYAGGVYLFILPPTFDELRRRLDSRDSDSSEVIEQRLRNAAGEIQESRWYDYIIVNDVFSHAVEEMKSVITAERCRAARVLDGLTELFDIPIGRKE